jgi:hypothetical protein
MSESLIKPVNEDIRSLIQPVARPTSAIKPVSNVTATDGPTGTSMPPPQVVGPSLVRPSDPFKQGLAGVTDIFTGIPGLLGLIGGGAETIGQSLFGEGEQDFTENFKRNITSGFAGDLLSASGSAQAGVNELLGIDFAESIEDQIARSIGSFIPIPGLAIAANASRLAKLARHSANILTPTVRTGKGRASFAKRGAAQMGLGIGFDQGIRSLIGEPNIGSDIALHGRTPEDVARREEIKSQIEAGELFPDMEGEVELVSSTSAIQPVDFGTSAIRPVSEISDEAAFERRRELDKQVQKAQDQADQTMWMIIAGTALTGYTAAKWRYARGLKKADEVAVNEAGPAPQNSFGQFTLDIDPLNPNFIPKGWSYYQGTPGVLWSGAKGAGRFLFREGVDSKGALVHGLRAARHPESNINQVSSSSHNRPEVSQEFIETGVLGQDFPGGPTHSLVDLDVEVVALSRQEQQLLDDAANAFTLREQTIRDSKSTLGEFVGETTHDAKIAEGLANTKVAGLLKKFSEVNDKLLDFEVWRKSISRADAEAFRARFRNRDGKLEYMPLYNVTKRGFFNRMAKHVGINTTRGKELAEMAGHAPRGLEETANPLGILEATKLNAITTIDAVNTNSYQLHVLEALAGVRIVGDSFKRVYRDIRGVEHESAATRHRGIEGAVDDFQVDHSGKQVSYIGRGEIDEYGRAVNFEVITPGQGKQGVPKFINKSSADELQKVHGEDAVRIQMREGVPHAFYVGDGAVQQALNVNPQLGAGLQFMNHYKNLFTRFTTGNLSLFAPISHLFSMQQTTLNEFARNGVMAAMQAPFRGMKGSFDLVAADIAKNTAQYLAFRIATNTGIGKWSPDAAKTIQRRLSEAYRKSLVSTGRTETGLTVSAPHADPYTGSTAALSSYVGKDFSKKFLVEEMKYVWRMWKAYNAALHEGPAYGVYTKEIGNARGRGERITAQTHRIAGDRAKTMSGDMRRVGASTAAKYFNASVPFSAAMIQSWNSIGSALKHNPGRFMAGAATLIGVPTAMELGYTQMLSMDGEKFDDPSGRIDPATRQVKQWSYNDYYWNGYTSEQRAANMIMFIPGKPPWEAVILPVSPEWGLFRGAVMEGLDAIFGFSNVGAIGQETEGSPISRQQWWAGFARVMDVPVPPLVAASLSAAGVDLRVGLQHSFSTDPDDPGPRLGFFQAITTPGGERLTNRAGESKFAHSTMDQDIVNIIQDIFGAAGALYVGVHESFAAGLNINADEEELGLGGSFGAGVSNALDAFGNGLNRQARWTQPLFGKALRPTASDEIARNLFTRRANLTRISNDFTTYFTGGLTDKEGHPLLGNTNVPIDDPIHMELAADAKDVLAQIGLLDGKITLKRKQLATLGNATNYPSQRAKYDLMDAITLEIQQIKAIQLSDILTFERRMSDFLTKRYRRPVTINLQEYRPRVNLSSSSASRILRQ